LEISVVVLADADPPFGQPYDADLASPNQTAASRLAERVELAPLSKSEDTLGCSVGFFALALPALGFTKRHCNPQ
jgi:hypothetical protein